MAWLAREQCSSSAARWARHQRHLPPGALYRMLHYSEQTRYIDMQHLQSCKSPRQAQLREDSWGFILSGMSYFLTRKIKSVSVSLYLQKLNEHTRTQVRNIFYRSACLLINTGCPRRNVQYFGRVFLMLNYTDITQNTYIQSWTVTEIMAREKCGLLAFPRIVRLQL